MDITVATTIDYLKQGQLVALPTETVYGLAASLSNPHAIENIYFIKGRPANNPMIVHVASLDQALELLDKKNLPLDQLMLLNEAYWPGPLTLILPVNPEKVPEICRAGLPTVAIRIPSHPLTLEVLRSVGPLVAPSANVSGRPSATSPEHVEEDFGPKFPIPNGGFCQEGIESTILYLREKNWELVRLGALAPEEFYPTLGYTPPIMKKNTKNPICPGHMYRHYSPKARLICDQPYDEKIETVLGFSDREYPKAKIVFKLGPLTEPHEIAQKLYQTLRDLDKNQVKTAWVDMDFPQEGILTSIAERLQRAAS